MMPDMDTFAIVFPGQGSQSVGMGRDIYDMFSSARTIFERADKVAGFSLSKLIFEGPEDQLRQTVNAQPAIVTVCLAFLAAMKEISIDNGLREPVFVAGHSLGEYSALAASDVLNAETAIHLARERGRLMQEAGEKNPGQMVAVLGMDEAMLRDVCLETSTVIANYNSPGQLVISGNRENISNAIELIKNRGPFKAIPLQVSGAFHSPLMQPAVEGMEKVLAQINVKTPRIPIIANVSAQPIMSPDLVKAELLKQLCNGVQWQRSIEYMINNKVSTFIEVGPGKVLAGLIKRINKNSVVLNINDTQSLNEITQKYMLVN
jgi:[acyl-carrier-protein] S-malonyltransferase